MAQPEALEAPPARRRRAVLLGKENRLVHAVARVPTTVRTKLLASFLIIAALLVLIGVLGLRLLGQSNARVQQLGRLQLQSEVYETLQAQSNELQQELGVRASGSAGAASLTGGKGQPEGGHRWILLDDAILDSLSQLSPETTEALWKFVPPATDEVVLRRIRSDYHRSNEAIRALRTLDTAGVSNERSQSLLQTAIDADTDLFAATNDLANRTGQETSALITANRSAYSSSRNLIITVSAVSVALALGLGLILSWALVGPLQRTESRLAEIAEGDFSGRLDVPNRDELGSLASNVNLMNEELQRLYGELETASRHKSEFLASMSHELRTPLNAIIGFSQVLRQRMFGELNEKQEEYLDDILSSGNHLLSLINDVLDLSKVEAGQVELEVAGFSLREALERGVVMVRERAVKNGVQLSLELAPDVDLVRRRRAAPPPGRLQPALERRQVHACRAAASRSPPPGRRRGAGLRHRHRPGHRAGGPGADLRGVPADRRRRPAPRRHRPRTRALEASRRTARRKALGRERARARQPLRLHVAGRGGKSQWPVSSSSSSRTTTRT